MRYTALLGKTGRESQLLLDEPSSALDPQGRKDVVEIIRSDAGSGL
ncbi:hypothetical protein HVS_10055 [Acetivibrio saccincola]|uniref:Uncharacterized protein n=1 Tax=Acetivibrio saccincola TaxID=1677857 RepID=A0A2K9E698_9FIRM|nr:hypothetical protein HVS_10055 [Acetivibrio saccincola]